MEEFRSNAMAVLNIKNLPDSLYRKLQARAKRQHRSVAQEVLTFSAMLLKRRNLCRFLVSRAWAKSTGEELTLRNMLSENGPHGIDGRSRGRPRRGRHVHLHLLQ